MIGIFVGDCVGSRFEWENIKTKEFELFAEKSYLTDDSIMTLAIAEAILNAEKEHGKLSLLAVKYMQKLGRLYPVGYGTYFREWLATDNPKPYGSFGNGSAMRVSPCAYAGKTLDEALSIAKTVTEVTHNHAEGIKGAFATTTAIFMALNKAKKSEIAEAIGETYYPMNFTLDGIRADYKFDATCQGSVPQAIKAFLESTDFEDSIRNAVSIGGDSDTIAAITGSIAGAYYGVPDKLKQKILTYMDDYQKDIIKRFTDKYVTNNAN